MREERDRLEGEMREAIERKGRGAGERRAGRLEEIRRRRGWERRVWGRRVFGNGEGGKGGVGWEGKVGRAQERRRVFLEGRVERARRFWKGRVVGMGKVEAARRVVVRGVLLMRGRGLLGDVGLLPRVGEVGGFKVLGFEEVVGVVEDERAVMAARFVLKALNVNVKVVSVRVFFTAFIIAYHPRQVMNRRCCFVHPVPDVLLYARHFVVGLAAGVSPRDLVRMHMRFYKAFVAWKKQDADALMNALITDAIALKEMDENAGKNASKRHQYAGFSMKNSINEIREAAEKIVGDQGPVMIDRALNVVSDNENEKILHDLLFDHESVLAGYDKEPVDDVEYWNSLLEELRATPIKTDVLRKVIRGIAHALNHLTKGRGEQIPEQIADQMAELTRESAVLFLNMAVGALQRCQAAADDTRLRIWTSNSRARLEADVDFPQAVACVLRELNRRVDAVSRATQRFQVEAIIPTVIEDGIEWERRNFRQRVEARIFLPDLPNTSEWLYLALNDTQRSQIDRNQLQMGSFPHIKQLLRKACMRSIDPLVSRTKESSPEILHLDTDRLEKHKGFICEFAIVCFLYRTAKVYILQHPDSAAAMLRLDFSELYRRITSDPSPQADLHADFVNVLQRCVGHELSDEDKNHFSSLIASAIAVDSPAYHTEIEPRIRLVVDAVYAIVSETWSQQSDVYGRDLLSGSELLKTHLLAFGTRKVRRLVDLAMEIHAPQIVAAAKRVAIAPERGVR